MTVVLVEDGDVYFGFYQVKQLPLAFLSQAFFHFCILYMIRQVCEESNLQPL